MAETTSPENCIDNNQGRKPGESDNCTDYKTNPLWKEMRMEMLKSVMITERSQHLVEVT